MNKLFIYCVLTCAGCSFTFAAHTQEQKTEQQKSIHTVEEVLVTGLPLQQTPTESALPLHVLAGDALRENANATLGDTVAQLPGLRSASFGGGVGRPVIRGQSSTRVRVLQNGTGTVDVSAVSPDHANAVEPLIARQIEVIRGPATLLYGSGAIGGVVNVVDNRIPKKLEENRTVVEYRHNTVNHGNTLVGTTDISQKTFAWHVDVTARENENINIPGFAVAEPDAEENTWGYIANSDQRSNNIAAGFSWIATDARVGFSVSELNNNYGIPPGVHEHEEHEDEEPEAGEEEHAEEDIRLDLKQQRLEFEGEKQQLGWIAKLLVQGSYTDYQHKELAEHEEESTLFTRDGYELRTSAQLDGPHKTVLGLQLQGNDFASEGEEAYLPAVEQNAMGMFGLYNVELNTWTVETGLRVERDELTTRHCEHTSTNWSASVAGIYERIEGQQWVASYTRSERAPAMEELFSNIDGQTCEVQDEPRAHFATGLIEIGNPGLRDETSGNIELSFRKHAGDIRGELNIFHNRVGDYIYLAIDANLDDETLANFVQQDASFTGLEATLTFPLIEWQDSHLDLSIGGDYVSAEFNHAETGAEYLPRIPPARVNMELAWWSAQAHVGLRIAENLEQDKLAQNETVTPAYTLLDIFAEYHWNKASVFLKLNNLLDEDIRNHSSQVKDLVPEPGRGAELGTRIYF